MTLASDITHFHRMLHAWYQAHGRRDLPWRHTADAYAILVSEMMLQQTQVDTVLKRFYAPFLQKFPDIPTLARASEREVMQAWQGLGYYRRAKYLHQTAQRSATQLPGQLEALLALPGIGRNTAHAVLAFAHHQPLPVMEANVRRVLCRIFALKTPSEKQLWQHAHELLDSAQPFNYNQAMMDIGAMVCTPRQPACGICPAQLICRGKHSPGSYPERKISKTTPTRQQVIVVVRDAQGFYYATPRGGEFLGGMYQFIELEPDETSLSLNGVTFPRHDWQALGPITQVYSHFKQVAEVYALTFHDAHRLEHWYSAEQLRALPLSKKEEKILRLLGIG